MIHAFYQRRLLRALAGQLEGAQELSLRKHIRRCDRCRKTYDHLSLLLAATQSPETGITRESARWQATLHAQTSTTSAFSGPWIRWAALALAPALVLLWWLQASQRAEDVIKVEEQVTWRGEEPDKQATNTSEMFLLLLYTSPISSDGKAGPVRLAAELPLSTGVSLSRDSYLQLGYRNLKSSGHLWVTLKDAHQNVHRLCPRGDDDAKVSKTDGIVLLPGSVAFGPKVAAGPAQICVWLGDKAPSEKLKRQLSQGSCPSVEPPSTRSNGFAARVVIGP